MRSIIVSLTLLYQPGAGEGGGRRTCGPPGLLTSSTRQPARGALFRAWIEDFTPLALGTCKGGVYTDGLTSIIFTLRSLFDGRSTPDPHAYFWSPDSGPVSAQSWGRCRICLSRRGEHAHSPGSHPGK